MHKFPGVMLKVLFQTCPEFRYQYMNPAVANSNIGESFNGAVGKLKS